MQFRAFGVIVAVAVGGILGATDAPPAPPIADNKPLVTAEGSSDGSVGGAEQVSGDPDLTADDLGAAPGKGQRKNGGGEISLETLPPAPTELDRLVRQAAVEFRFGGEPPESPRDTSPPPDFAGSLDALTTFTIAYDYDLQTRWTAMGRGDQRELRIDWKIQKLRWVPRHLVWFRRPPRSEDFWSDPLVLHELDHVRLSSDPRLARRFEEMLSGAPRIRVPLPGRFPVTDAVIRRAVGRHIAATFDEVVALIEIRYQELDRVTAHGRVPLAEDSEVAGVLRGALTAAGESE